MVTRVGRALHKNIKTVSWIKLKDVRVMLSQNTNEFCKNTTLHGLKYVSDRELHRSERLFFAVSFVAVLLVSGYLMLHVYDRWRTSPVIIGTNPEPTFITNEPFPAVTICNLNQALNSTAQQFAKTSTEYAMLELLCKRNPNDTIASSITDWSGLEDFIVNISQPCEKMIVGCRFGAREFACEEFFHSVVTDEGLCCVFNMLHPKFMYLKHTPKILRNITMHNVYKPINWNAEQGYPADLPAYYYPRATAGTGESLGLAVTLDVQHNEYFCSSANGIGFKIALHSPNESPNVRETGVVIAPGHETKLRIEPQKTEAEQHLRSVGLKYRRCLFQNEVKLQYFAHYTQRNCEMECVGEMLMKYCGCVSVYMPQMYKNATICSIHKVKCVESVRLRTDPTITSCLDSCWPSCYDLSFVSDAFTTKISHDGFGIVDQKVENFSHRYVEQSIAVVTLYFKDNSFHSNIQTEFIGITDFLSNVGGLMGLFLGFSFLSIIEIIYFAIIRPCRSIMQFRQDEPAEANVLVKVRTAGSPRRYLRRRHRLHGNYRNSPNFIYPSRNFAFVKNADVLNKEFRVDSPEILFKLSRNAE